MQLAMTRRLRTSSGAILAVMALGLVGAGSAWAEIDDAERARVESELEQTRAEIRRLSERLADLSIELTEQPLRKIIRHRAVRANRAAIGATIQSVSDESGVTVLAVTPDGPADKAGLEAGDVILGIDEVSFVGDDGVGAQRLSEFMEAIEVGDTVTVHVERDGQNLSRELTTELMRDTHGQFAFAFDDENTQIDLGGSGLPLNFGTAGDFDFLFHTGPWSDMELVELTATLGDYFGVTEGLLVVRAPKDTSLAVQDGDVITELNGQAVSGRRDLFGALAELDAGDTVSLEIVRQRQSMNVEARVPEASPLSRRFKFASPQIFIHRSDEDHSE